MEFANKVVLITGAGAGIGYECALQFADAGARLVVNSRSERNARAAAEAIRERGGEAEFVAGDASDEAVARAIVGRAAEVYGAVDILVNCAGVVPQGSVLVTAPEEWDEVMRVNVKSVYLMSRFAIPEMRKRGGGAIVNVSSVIATKGFPNRALYAASKGAIFAMTKSMAADHIKENIRVNSISPGTVLSESLQRRIDGAANPVDEKKMYESRQPLGRLGTPAEIAQGILFLAADKNSFMTGANLVIDGGVSI